MARAADMIPQPAGQGLTLNGGSNPRTVQIASSNPAAPVTSDLGGFWFGFGAAGVGYEVGDFKNLIDLARDLQHDLDNCKNSGACTASDVETRTNAFIGLTVGDSRAVVKLFANAQVPFIPMGASFPGLGGVFTLNAEAVGAARLRFVGRPNSAEFRDKPGSPDDPSAYSTASAHACTGSNCELVADFAMYAKGAGGGVISLGYSAETLHRMDGSLFVGGRANYYKIDFSRGMVEVASSSVSDDFKSQAKDEFDRHKISNSKVGFDAGLMWAAHNFRFGGTLKNLNEPTFDYPDIGTGCAAGNSPDAVNCRAVSRLAPFAPGEILLHDSYKMKRQVQLETAVYDSDRTLSAGVTYDVRMAPDAIGDDYQWLGASASFAPRGWGFLVPALRAGYRKNQAGSKLRMATAGLSLFRVINLDAAMSLDKVDNNGTSIPRSAMVNLSFELYF